MAKDGIDLKNINEMKKFLMALPDQLARRVERQALMASGKIVKRKMKDNLKRHRRTGELIRSIKVQSAKKRRGDVTVLVGAIKSRNLTFLPDGFYARFLERGTSKQPPRPWAGPALAATHHEQRKAIALEYATRGMKEIKRQAKRIIGV